MFLYCSQGRWGGLGARDSEEVGGRENEGPLFPTCPRACLDCCPRAQIHVALTLTLGVAGTAITAQPELTNPPSEKKAASSTASGTANDYGSRSRLCGEEISIFHLKT